MRRCLTCDGRFEPRRLICPNDKDMLVDEGTPTSETGQIVASRYRLSNLLGEGGMGRVYEAIRLDSGETVALKQLKLDRSKSERERSVAKRRFQREAEAASSLESPGITRVIEFADAEDGTNYLVMERLYGATFDELRRAGKLATPERVVELMKEVCAIVGLAHDRGIVHRDLKPSNLFLHRVSRDSTQVKILDFGIAKFLGREGEALTATGEFLGTLLYMAPEQARGEPVGTALDVYTLGIILFEALAGRVPFDGANPWELIRLHASAPPPSLRSLRSDVSGELDAMVSRCLSKRPQDRYGSASELAAALRDLRSARGLDEPVDRTQTLRVNPSRWVGIVLDDRYELQEWVSRGRFGSDVYRAIHLRTDATIAVRLWRTSAGPVRDCLQEAFRREAKSMGIRHPSLIPVIDLGFDESGVYIVTEFVESVSLRDLLAREGPMKYETVARLLRGPAGALAALHAGGIISGGLSPETIRVTREAREPRELLISPFGLRNLQQMNLLLRQFGSLDVDDRSFRYISPEQKAGEEPDGRSDLYSLGAIAFEMLGARCEESTALAARTLTEAGSAIRRSESSGPSVQKGSWEAPAGLSEELRAFFERALHPEPQRRFANAAEFLEAMPRP